MENPYRPPTAPVRDPLPPGRSPTLAVLAGIGISLVGTLISSVVVAAFFSLMLAAQDRDIEEFDPRQPAFGIVVFFAGGAFSLLGGYVCARMVRRNERRVTGIMASLGMAVTAALALVVAVQSASLPAISWGWSAVRLVVTGLLVVAGGELGRRRNLANALFAGAGDTTAA
jgi:peptidoglycan/LPS O-acetylase OafA/YrhL